jgi:hypothetical protein
VNVHDIHVVRQSERYTVQPLIPEPSSFEV